MRGAGLSWLLPAAWLAYQNNGLLAHRVAQLLPLGGSVPVLVLVASVVAGLVGGLAGLAGTWLRQARGQPPCRGRASRPLSRLFAGVPGQHFEAGGIAVGFHYFVDDVLHFVLATSLRLRRRAPSRSRAA